MFDTRGDGLSTVQSVQSLQTSERLRDAGMCASASTTVFLCAGWVEGAARCAQLSHSAAK
jgi:hypothetical protein